MEFELLTLTGTKFSGDVKQVTLRTAEGDIGILPDHEPLTAAVAPGPVTVYKKGGDQNEVFAVFGGLLEVAAGRVRLLADEAELAEELIANEVEAALKHAETLKAAAKDKVELARAQELVDREVVRLGVAKMRRHPRRER